MECYNLLSLCLGPDDETEEESE
eukprot:SAG22_NODE_4951_length_1123_cov_88.268555_1_plen_22_part_10